jgi:hypothetical protein
MIGEGAMQSRREDRLRSALTGDGSSVAPTPETLAKLRYDVIGRLVADGRLLRAHADAAEEIRAVVEAVGRGMLPTARPTFWAGRPQGHRGPRDFLDRMSSLERRLWQFRYLPWTRALIHAGDASLPGRRWVELVLDIVVDNSGLRRVERRYRLRHGSALGFLADGLERYDGLRR